MRWGCAVLCAIIASSAVADVWVSPQGDDRWPGARRQPVATLSTALHLARQQIHHRRDRPLTVWLMPGQHVVSHKLLIGRLHCPVQGLSIRSSDPTRRACITGTMPVSGWQESEPGLWSAPVPAGAQFHTLYRDGHSLALARHPNSGWLTTENGAVIDGASIVTAKPGDVPSNLSASDVYVDIWAGAHHDGWAYDWYQSRASVTSWDPQTRRLTLGSPTWWQVSANNRYALSGSRLFLDREGEWWHDRQGGRLWLISHKRPVNIQRPVIGRVIDIKGDAISLLVGPVRFVDVDFAGNDAMPTHGPAGQWSDGMVFLYNTRDVAFTRCRFRGIGDSAISGFGRNTGLTVKGCRFTQIGFCGLLFMGYPPGDGPFRTPEQADVSRNFVIEDCLFDRCGERLGHGAGIWLYQSGRHRISRCTFRNLPRNAVCLLGYSYNYMKAPRTSGGLGGVLYGLPVNWANHLRFLHTRQVRIERCLAERVMSASSDGGAFNAWAAGSGNAIVGNLITDVKAFYPRAIIAGIYLDDASKWFTVRGNVIRRLGGSEHSYPFIIKGMHNVVERNVVADCDFTAACLIAEAGLANRPDSDPGIADERVGLLTLRRNIIWNSHGPYIYSIYPWRDDTIQESDYNVWSFPVERAHVQRDWVGTDWAAWRQLQNGRYDPHTSFEVVSPRDPARGDYRLPADSDGWKRGTTGADVRQVGCRPTSMAPEWRP